MIQNHYIVVTIARNEEEMLPGLAVDIVTQTVRPIMWFIGDDGSSDSTWDIIRDLKKRFSWVKGVRLRSEGRRKYAQAPYNIAIKKIINYAINKCNNCNVNYDFLAVVDADVRLEKRYFEKLLKVFDENPRLGIASGIVYEEGLSQKELKRQEEHPKGVALLFRKACFEEIGGFLGHSLSIVKARIRKWDVKIVHSAKVLHRRKTETRRRKHFFFTAGERMYFINKHPVNVFLAAVDYTLKTHIYNGISFLAGYLCSFLLQKDKIKDKEIREYYWNGFNRLIRRILKKFKATLR